MKSSDGVNQVENAEKAGIKLFTSRFRPSVDLHPLEQILHQMACPVLEHIKRPFFLAMRHSLTYDRGREVAGHPSITLNKGMKFYFCDPYRVGQ